MDVRVQVAIQVLSQSQDTREALALAGRTTNLSISRLRHLIKSETGLPPGKYTRRLKLEQAAELLGNSFLSVKEVACKVGFDDISHFVRNFKSRFGLTPSCYRRTFRRDAVPKQMLGAANSANV